MTTLFYYRSQRSCGKVMFLHVSDSVHRGGGSLSQHAPQVTWPGGVSGSLSRGSLSIGGFYLGCPRGSLSRESLSRGSLSRGSLLAVSVYGSLSGGGSAWGGLCPGGSCPGGFLPRGSLSGGLCLGGLCPGGSLCWVCVREPPLPPYGNEQAVRILLECILVYRILLKHNIVARFHVILFWCCGIDTEIVIYCCTTSFMNYVFLALKITINDSIHHWKSNEPVIALHRFSGEQIKVGEVFDTFKTHNSEDARGIFLLANEPFRTGVIYQWVRNVISFLNVHFSFTREIWI